MKTLLRVSIIGAALLAVGLLSSCDLFNPFNPTNKGFPTVGWWGGEVAYGATVTRDINLNEVPYSEDFELGLSEGDGPVSLRNIADVTYQDEQKYHDGNMDIAYADVGRSFDITSSGYPFTITLSDNSTANNPVASGGTYEIEVAIQNNGGITPNPYIFRYRVNIN